ncbi:MAG TPA: hypothetical protein VK558_18330 [Patescibacteria group bacterium]|nr:hypothetical protein [Patescibacteria group bacterium]
MSTIIGRHIDASTTPDGPSLARTAVCSVVLALFFLSIGGCISSSSPPAPAPSSTVVVPNGSTVICSNGSSPPCR